MTILSPKKIIITVLSAAMFYVIFAIFSDINEIQNYFMEINPIYIFPIISLLVLSQFIRSLSQRYILAKLDIKISLKDSFLLFLTGLSMIVTPGGSGQVIKSHFLKQKYNEPIDKSFPLVFVERLIDLIAISIILFITLFTAYMMLESLIALILSISMIVILLILFRSRRILRRVFRIFSKIKFLRNVFPDESRFTESFEKIFRPNVLSIPSLIILGSFMTEGFVIYLGFMIFGIDLGYLKSIQLYYTSILYGAISLVPGGLGITEGSLAALLSKEINSIALITSIIIFIRLTTIWFSASLGIITAYFEVSRK